jgi:hypothetical protein
MVGTLFLKITDFEVCWYETSICIRVISKQPSFETEKIKHIKLSPSVISVTPSADLAGTGNGVEKALCYGYATYITYITYSFLPTQILYYRVSITLLFSFISFHITIHY